MRHGHLEQSVRLISRKGCQAVEIKLANPITVLNFTYKIYFSVRFIDDARLKLASGAYRPLMLRGELLNMILSFEDAKDKAPLWWKTPINALPCFFIMYQELEKYTGAVHPGSIR